MRHRAIDESDEIGELNLTPYLDVIMNLVMFLLVSFLSVSTLNVIEVSAPAICTDCEGGAAKANFSAVLSLTEHGAMISASDGSVPSESLPGPLDPARLTDALAGWKQTYGLGQDLTVSATADTPYMAVVTALDAAREDAGQPLFPGVKLARAVR